MNISHSTNLLTNNSTNDNNNNPVNNKFITKKRKGGFRQNIIKSCTNNHSVYTNSEVETLLPTQSMYPSRQHSSKIAQLCSILPNPSHIKERPGSGGKIFRYLASNYVIHKANMIFGIFGYNEEIIGDPISEQLIDEQANCIKILVTIKYKLTVTTEDGLIITRYNIGTGVGNLKDIPESIVLATKKSITDARKRTLVTFGVAFGLALYDENYKHK